MASASRPAALLREVAKVSRRCPCHGGGGMKSLLPRATASHPSGSVSFGQDGVCGHTHEGPHHLSTASVDGADTEYAFEVATSTIRFGPGATSEVGFDFANMGAKKVLVLTDSNLGGMRPVNVAVSSLVAAGVNHVVYDQVRVEPTDSSMKDAIEVARRGDFDAFLAVGGGSVMDTAKAANLYATFQDAEFLDFVNAPVGKGLPVPGPVMPLIAVPTTSGTGSETTGVSIFDYEPLGAKTGIASRVIRPTLGIVDPLNTKSMPKEVAVASGFDVLCHALESFTAIPFQDRTPRPANPNLRPAYQGSNPVSDVWARHALGILREFFFRAVEDPEDMEAVTNMALAAAYAGVGFGNAGVHLPHGMSYPISGLNKKYKHPGYDVGHGIVPHGISVVMSAPAVFRFTAPTNPARHIEAAGLLGADTEGVREEDAGYLLSDTILKYMQHLDVPNGLEALGYSSSDLDALVKGTLPQRRVLDIAPSPPETEDLHMLFEQSLRCY